jgi:lycopene cyclase domain-containing protein
MTYALLCAVFLVAALVVAAIAWRRAPRGHAWALALSAAALIVLTAVFDNVMIATGLFGYADAQISGVRLGLAPIEDFAYPLAGVLLLPAVWNLFGGRREASAQPAASESAEASAHGRRTRDDAHD